ncbi:MAG: ABC transporter transmembrane domain-containing protein [Neomegalonema sp.]|nr:ABC transporter transmembrane domain-containing protein [Neomegalonema sp.]
MPAENERAEDRQKSKSVSSLRALWPFLQPHRGLIVAAFTALVFASVFTLAVPVAFGRVIDALGEGEKGFVDNYFLAFFGVAAMLALATAARSYVVTRLGERVIADIRRAVFDHVITMSPGFFEQIRTGETLSRLTTDTSVIQSVIGASASVALRNILLVAGGILMMMISAPGLTGLVLLIVPLVVAPIVILGRRVRALSRESQDRIAEASGIASETLLAAPTVQAFTFEREAQNRFGGAVEAAYESARQRIKARSWMVGIVIFLIFSAICAVLWLGARLVIAGAMTGGELAQFLLYAVFVAGAVGALSEIWSELQRAAGATERLMELLAARSEIQVPANPIDLPAPPRGEVAFDAVTFTYPSRPDVAALHDFSLTVAAGETVALVGPSGAGKSTVFQLLLRFYDPQSGQIRLDGAPVDQLRPQALRSRFALVPQEPVIFADTAAANIAFGSPGASREAIEAAARAAAAHDFIESLPNGYDSYVGERGVMLSGGQKQRIAIARAILRDAPVLLLDEATSALDAQSERAVQDAVERLSAQRTTIVIAHRLATVKKADRIVVMDGGAIQAVGTHEALVAQGGLYADLARLQFTE